MADPQPTPTPPTQFDRLALDVLQWLAKTLGQMSLYKVGHPAVAATLQSSHQYLLQALGQASGELIFSVDEGKWIVNGRVIGATNQTPQALAGLFSRFKLSSITFKAGVTYEELIAFCELAAMRPDASQAINPKAYLVGRSVKGITLDEAVYAKMGKGSLRRGAGPGGGASGPGGSGAGSAGPGAGPGSGGDGEGGSGGNGPGEGGAGGGGSGSGGAGGALAGIPGLVADGATLDSAIQALVSKAVPDPAQRAQVLERVMQLVQADIQRRVAEVTKVLHQEKNVLQNEQTRTQAVIGNAVEGVVVVDEQGKILMMNPAAEQIYGTTLAQAAGKHLTEKAGEEHVITLAAELTAPADREIRKDIKVEVKGEDDTRRTLRSAGAVVQNEAGKVVGMVSSLPDVAKHKELQKIQRDFVAHVTHELRAPLSSIRAALEILEESFTGKLKADEAKMLSTALRNSDRLAEMINSILDFSKIESGQMTVARRQTNAEKIAREAVESVSSWAAKKQLAVTLSVAPGLPPIHADEKRTIQVLINLLSNAIKFTPAGGRVTVALGASHENRNKFVEFSVADSGPGIAKADQKKIFEKFVQVASGEVNTSGTGLGLSIAKALVNMQSGTLWVDSDVGCGATFAFTLPIYIAPREETITNVVSTKKSQPWWKKILRLK